MYITFGQGGYSDMLDLLRAVFKYSQKQSPDKLGLYPEKVHTNAIPERRYLWASRLLVIFASLSICFNIMLVSILYVLLPQRGAESRLLVKDDYFNQLKLIKRQEVKVAPKDLLIESFVREYVTLRHSITSQYDDLKFRWAEGSRFYWMSTPAVYREFASDNIDQLIYSYQSRGFTRSIDIEFAYPISNGLWVVRFATYDYYTTSKLPIINIWHAYIRSSLALIDYENKSLRYLNPFGFVVTSYSLSYIGSPNNVASYLQDALKRRMLLHY